MVGTSGQSCSSERSGTQWVMPSHLNLNGIDQNWHWNWLSAVGVPSTTSRTVPWTTVVLYGNEVSFKVSFEVSFKVSFEVSFKVSVKVSFEVLFEVSNLK